MRFLERIASIRALLWQFWFWILNIPPFVFAYIVLNDQAFTSFSLLYLGIITIITAALGALSSLVAEQVAQKQVEDADVQEVLDVVEDIRDSTSDKGGTL